VQQQIAELSARLNVVLPSHGIDHAAVDERPASAPRSTSAKGGKARGRCVIPHSDAQHTRDNRYKQRKRRAVRTLPRAAHLRVTVPGSCCELYQLTCGPAPSRAEPSRAEPSRAELELARAALSQCNGHCRTRSDGAVSLGPCAQPSSATGQAPRHPSPIINHGSARTGHTWPNLPLPYACKRNARAAVNRMLGLVAKPSGVRPMTHTNQRAPSM
jgi:hypothetical protein